MSQSQTHIHQATAVQSNIMALVRHTLDTLPDSVSFRSMILGGLLAILPAKCPARLQISELLITLEQHKRVQQRAQLEFAMGGCDPRGHHPTSEYPLSH